MAHTLKAPGSARRLARGATGIAATTLAVAMLATPAGAAGGFTGGDVVVYRVGDGSAALSSAATAVFLDEFAPVPSSAPAFTLPLPTTAAPNRVTSSGTATSEGELTLSGDGKTLLATGYNAPLGTASVAGTASSSVSRVAAEIDATGAVDTSTALTSQLSGNNVRSAASADGSTVYVAGAAGLIEVARGASSGTALTTAPVNFRQAAIFAGQLYASSASGSTRGVQVIGSGLPTAPVGAVSPIPGVDSGSATDPYGYVLFNEKGGSGPDTAYVVDNTKGQIQKYGLVAGTWTAEGTAALSGATGLAGSYASGVATLYATSASSLVTISDGSGQAGTLTGSPTVLATAPANEAFRGVALAPAASPASALPETPWAAGLPLLGMALAAGSYVALRRRPARG